MTVSQLRRSMTSAEFSGWLAYFEDKPAEWEMSERIEIMLARFATGFFKGTVEDHLLLSKKQRDEANKQEFMESIKALGLPG